MKVILIAMFLLLGLSACAQKSVSHDGSYERANAGYDKAQADLAKE
jgi:outer membrane lipoprotein-sorting protein